MARQALAVARDNPEVLRVAGFALAAFAGENETALTAINRAIELNPNYAFAYAQRGIVLAYLNRPDEAIIAAERAIRLSPNDPTVLFSSYLALGLAYLFADRYEEALSGRASVARKQPGCPRCASLSLCGCLYNALLHVCGFRGLFRPRSAPALRPCRTAGLTRGTSPPAARAALKLRPALHTPAGRIADERGAMGVAWRSQRLSSAVGGNTSVETTAALLIS